MSDKDAVTGIRVPVKKDKFAELAQHLDADVVVFQVADDYRITEGVYMVSCTTADVTFDLVKSTGKPADAPRTFRKVELAAKELKNLGVTRFSVVYQDKAAD